MASRKTYFGIGWPKDGAPDPDAGATGKNDPEDRSGPTVVDDEKVAEGLRQLRSWYQEDAQQGSGPTAAPPSPATALGPPAPPTALGLPAARPTAVGHATAPPAAAAVQRPVAPDPMRATMYGHDVHKFDLDALMAEQQQQQAQQPPQLQPPQPQPQPQAHPQPPSSTTALVITDPTRQQGGYHANPEGVPQSIGAQPSDPFRLATFGHGEAERLQRPARRSGAFTPPRPAARVPVASRVMFAIGLVALAAAVIFWVQSGSDSSAGPTPAPTVAPAPTAPPALATPPIPLPPPTAPAAPDRAAGTTPAPERSPIPAPPAPIPAAPTTVPKTSQLRLSAPPEASRPQHRRPAVKPVAVESAETGDAPAPAAAPSDSATPEPKDLKTARPTDKEPKEAQEPKEAREPKEMRDAKETKATKAKEWKLHSGDSDNTMPPSLE
jgi:hypothetical protein